VSGLWTPHGEHRPEAEPSAAADPAGFDPAGAMPGEGREPTPEEEAAAREQLRQIREQLANTPVADIIANHVIGLWELALLHLTSDDGQPPDLDQARLAIDAVAAVVEGLGDRLGNNAQPLRDALAQLQLAYVEVSKAAPAGGA
jgi:hypothetical protein